ncbi:acyl-coenzyme A diphosphatase FITM2-like [Mya arenaria]|uniref:acyl-coenzyme A diphosphatase FITM2-like n=1 Tax=Mya arenaria TaxID=6604 RepID=UPI0022E90A05|nr:acyl-coenzyme A diphosphatase FITM2-like [Mya arenaria]
METRSASKQRNFAKNDTSRKSRKKPLPEPTHVGHFISILIISLCKKILHIDTEVKIGIYLGGVLIGSVFSDIISLPKTYFSDKKNLLNQFFVHFGFGWTFLLLTGYIFLTCFVTYSGNWKPVIRKHLTRLVITTFWWYAMTNTFSYIDKVVGVCSLSSHKKKYDCLKAGRSWLGFDISGHVFLLIHNLLTISEEVKSFKNWTKLGAMLKEEDLPSKKNLSELQISQARIFYRNLTPVIKIIIVLLALWTLFCEIMLVTSVVYRFHTMTQKIAAAVVSVVCWFITYRVILESKVDVFPVQPGQSPLNYMKLK